jgi:FkbM family methyltransferase
MILEPKKIIPLLKIQYGMNVMDVGSGIGYWSKPIAELVGPNGNVFSIDNHPETIDRLHHDIQESQLPQIHPLQADIHDIRNWHIKKQSCDRIIVIRMISSIESVLLETIDQLAEFLSNQGELIIIDGLHNESVVHQALRESSISYHAEYINEIKIQTDNYFFGMRITRQ